MRKIALDSAGIPYYVEETAKHVLQSKKMSHWSALPKALNSEKENEPKLTNGHRAQA